MSKVLAEASNIGTGSGVAQRQRRVMFSNGAEGNQNEAVHVDGSGESGVNSPLAGKRCPTRASSERAKKVVVNKAADCVRENCVRKKSAS